MPPPVPLAELRYDDRGLLPVVVQQHDSGQVLMVAWADRQALTETLERGEAVYWSRSRQQLWHKGATSGDTQRVVAARVDCDADTVLLLVDQQGDGACHTGQPSCFGRGLETVGDEASAAPPRWPEGVAP